MGESEAPKRSGPQQEVGASHGGELAETWPRPVPPAGQQSRGGGLASSGGGDHASSGGGGLEWLTGVLGGPKSPKRAAPSTRVSTPIITSRLIPSSPEKGLRRQDQGLQRHPDADPSLATFRNEEDSPGGGGIQSTAGDTTSTTEAKLSSPEGPSPEGTPRGGKEGDAVPLLTDLVTLRPCPSPRR